MTGSVITRERASATYRTSSYYVSKVVTDLPRTAFFSILFSAIVYFIIGLKIEVGAFFRFVLVVFGISGFGESLAIAISIFTGNAQASAALAPVIVIISVLFSGLFTQTDQIPAAVRWIKWISFVFYAANAFAKNEFPGRLGGDEILDSAGFNGISYWGNLGALYGLAIALRTFGYLALKFLRGPKFMKF